jgi:hypothetical protein
MSARKLSARLQVVIDPETLIWIEDYRPQRRFVGDVEARLNSKSDAIRTLIRLGLQKELPPEHVRVIERIHVERKRRTVDDYNALMTRFQNSLKKTNLVLEPITIAAIDRYKNVANRFYNANLESRTDVIHRLLKFSLEGTPPDNHLEIVDCIQDRIRERARLMWENEGSPSDEDAEKSRERWLAAQGRLDNEDAAATKRPTRAKTPHTPNRPKPS